MPDDPDILRHVGISYFATGEYSKATKFLERLLTAQGESVYVLNLLGRAYHFEGEAQKAAEAWRRSLALDPEQDSIRKLLKEAEKQDL